MAQCPKCNCTNPSDARFCQNCGKKLVLICRRCGTENWLGTQFCKSCGVNLAEAKFSVSDNFAQKSWNFFSSFSVFNEMTSASGWVKQQIYPYTKQLLAGSNLKDKSLIEEKMAFFLPITNRDWCISFLQFDNITIKYGALWAGTSGFAIFDFDQRLVYFILYEWLGGCSQRGDVVNLTLSQGNTISMTIRTSRPSDAGFAIGSVLDTTFYLLNIFVVKDKVAEVQDEIRRDRDIENYQNRVNYANSYVESISDFFSEIVAIKKDIERAQNT